MPSQYGMVSTKSAHLEALKIKHQSLSKKIELGQSKFFMSDTQISELKREKLKLKEEIEGIRKAS